MDRSQTRTALVLSVVLAAAAGLLWWQGRPTTEETSDATEAVWVVDPAQVAKVELDRPEGRLVLERRAGEWWLTEPEVALAEPRHVEELIGRLAGWTRAVPVEAPADGLDAFGLGEPPATRVTWTSAAGVVQTLSVGTRAPAAYSTYVATASGGVGAANGDASSLLHGPATDYRDRRVFRAAPGEVRSVRIAFPEHTLEVRGSGHHWHLTGYGRAEADEVDNLVTDLLDLRFDDEDPALVVPAPRITVELSLEDGSTQLLSLAPSEGYGFPARAPDGRTGRVFDGAERMLSRGPTDVGQRTAFQLRPDVADRVSVEGLGKSFRATRNGSAWTTGAGDDPAVYDRVQAMSLLAVERSLDPAGPSDPPEAHVTVHEPAPLEGGEPIELNFVVGPALADGTRTVRDPAGPGPGVRISASAFDAFVKSLP